MTILKRVCEICFTRAAACVRSLESPPCQELWPLQGFFPPFFEHKRNERDYHINTHTLTNKHVLHLCLLYISLTVDEVISRVSTCYLAFGCAHFGADTRSLSLKHTHTREQQQALSLCHTETHCSLFSDKGFASAALS